MSSTIRRTVLILVRSGDQILMIRKKRGDGKEFINFPGGKIEPGETPEGAAIRECEEETGLRLKAVQWKAHLDFKFEEGLLETAEVFTANFDEGNPVETEEAFPFWNSVASMPYDQMWESDRLWVEKLFQTDAFFSATFYYDGHTLVRSEIH
ncbi:MAG: 8-oxo-dGTP diphosphatase [Verrucomicrobiota bacterium]